VGFFALCLLGASAWLVEAEWPSVLPTMEQRALHDLAIAAVAGVAWWRIRARVGVSAQSRVRLAAASVCLLGLPAVLVDTASSGVSQVNVTATFALLPVLVVLLVSQFDVERAGTMRMLAPAIVGLAGVMFLLPVSLPSTLHECELELVVVLAVAIAGAASVWMYRLLAEFAPVEAVFICALANGVFFALAFAVDGAMTRARVGPVGGWSRELVGVEIAKALLFDLPQFALLLWLMRVVAPVRLAARALVIPLLTVIEGYAILHPAVSAREMGGAALAFVGAIWLMTARPDEEPALMLR
jgi:drug/metabolite transporter (DMT)-like permease